MMSLQKTIRYVSFSSAAFIISGLDIGFNAAATFTEMVAFHLHILQFTGTRSSFDPRPWSPDTRNGIGLTDFHRQTVTPNTATLAPDGPINRRADFA